MIAIQGHSTHALPRLPPRNGLDLFTVLPRETSQSPSLNGGLQPGLHITGLKRAQGRQRPLESTTIKSGTLKKGYGMSLQE